MESIVHNVIGFCKLLHTGAPLISCRASVISSLHADDLLIMTPPIAYNTRPTTIDPMIFHSNS